MTAWADKHSSKEVPAEGYFPVAFYRIRSIFATTTSSLVAFKKNVGLRHFYIFFHSCYDVNSFPKKWI